MNKGMVTFEEFSKSVCNRIKDFLPEEYQSYDVRLEETEKIGKGKLTALLIKNPDSYIVPSQYLDGYYEMMLEGAMTMQEILMHIANQRVESEKMDLSEGLAFSYMMTNHFDWDHVKSLVVIEAVNGETNRSMLEKIPHTMVGDIAGIYRLFVSENQEGRQTVLLDNEKFQLLGISLAQLHQKAVENTAAAYPIQIRSLNSVVADMGYEEAAEITKKSLYVVTTENLIDGATTIFYPSFGEEVEKIYPQGCYILPSSIHEVMLIDKDKDVQELTNMVVDINKSCVAPEELLSNRVYEYNPVTKTIEFAIKDTTFRGMQKGQHVEHSR